MRAAHLDRRSLLTRVAHVAGAVALVTIAAAALVVGGSLMLLRTSWGGDLARRIGLRVANQQLAGRLDVRRLRFAGDSLRLDDVVLRDPRGGAVVARVRRLDVAFRPLALLRRHVELGRVVVVGPELHLAVGADGTNLQRALAPRSPSPPATTTTTEGDGAAPSPLVLTVGGLEVVDGSFELRRTGVPADAALRYVRASRLGGKVSGRLAVDGWRFEGRVSVKAGVEAPTAAPLSLEASATGEGDRRAGAVTLSLGGAVLEATAETHRAATGAFAASTRVRRLHVPHSLVRAAFPSVPLAAPVDATLNAALKGAVLSAEARATAGGGTVEARGVVDLAQAHLRELAVDGRDVDLGRVVAGLPRSSFPFELRARGRARRAFAGDVSFATPGGLLGGYALGPVRLRAGLSRGGLDLSELRAVLPGTTVTARGWLRRGGVDVRADVDAADLAKTARSLGPALAPLDLGGRGRLELRAAGSLSRPTFSVRGRFPSLKVQGVAARDLTLNASLLGERLTADVRMAAPRASSLHVDARVALDRGTVNLDALEVAYPDTRWRLAGPARIVVDRGLLQIDGFELRAGAQALRADLQVERDGRLDARVAVVALDLASLPAFVRPGGRALGGRFDLTARVTGTRRQPALEAHAKLANARLGDARDLALSLDVVASRARLQGTVAARGLATSARGRFDVPAAWPPGRGRGPLEIDLDVAPTDLAAASLLLRLPGPALGGNASLALRVTGTPAEPAMRLEVTTHGLVVGGTPLGDPHLALVAARGAPTRLRIDAQPSASARAPTLAGALSMETPTALGRLVGGALSPAQLLQLPISARGEVQGIPLGLVARALGVGHEVRGTAALRLEAAGTARALEGAVNVSVRGAASPAFPPTDARVDVAMGPRDTRLAARVSRQGQPRPLAALSVVWGTPLARLWAGPGGLEAAAREAPLDVQLQAGPAELKHTSYLPLETSSAQDLRALARVTARVTGTLSRPKAEATAVLSRAHLGKADLGRALVQLRYADGQGRATANASSVGGGTLKVEAATRVDLGWPGGLAALDPPTLPLDATVEARAFDLAWLGGVTDAVRQVAGKLEARARVGGTLAAPTFAGRLEWRQGAVAISEIGEYRDVHVAVSAAEGRFSIEDVRATSRGGTAHLTGQVTRASAGDLDVVAKADLSRFPLYGQGDVLGTLSTKLALRASVTGRAAKGRVVIEEAKAELGEIRRKDVQSLERPANVVLVSGGRPVNQAEARKASALEAERLGTSPVDAASGASWSADADLVAPRNIWVRGEEAELELGLSDGFKVETGAATRVSGSVIVRRGTVNVIGRRFTIQKDSTVTFSGAPDEPTLDVVARHVNERSKTTVVVTLRGKPDDLRVDVSSPDRPDLNQTQLYGLLVTGQLDGGERMASGTGTSGLSSEAASLVGGLLASTLQKTLRKRLPLDVLSIQAGTGITGSRLEAGTYIGSRLYVGYVGRVGSDPILLQNRNAVRVEYQFSPRWSLDAEYGDVGTGTADLVWNKHY